MKRTPLRPISAKKANRDRDAFNHMLEVKQLPCMICGAPPPSEAHHSISGRYGGRKRSDWWVTPMCSVCHRTGPHAIHNGKRSWEERHGPDYGFLPRVYGMLGKEMPEEIKEMIDAMATD